MTVAWLIPVAIAFTTNTGMLAATVTQVPRPQLVEPSLTAMTTVSTMTTR
jgi:hypothetical protein